MLSTRLESQYPIAIALSHTIFSYHTGPCHVVCANSGIEIAKEDEFVMSGHGFDQCVQVIIQFFLDFLGASNGRHLGTDDSQLLLV